MGIELQRYGWGGLWIYAQTLIYILVPIIVSGVIWAATAHFKPGFGAQVFISGATFSAIGISIISTIYSKSLLERQYGLNSLIKAIDQYTNSRRGSLDKHKRILIPNALRDKGFWCIKLAKLSITGGEFDGIDINWKTLFKTGSMDNYVPVEIFETNRQLENLTNPCNISYGDLRDLKGTTSIQDDFYDVIVLREWTLNATMPHRGPDALAEALRVIRPGGKIIMTVSSYEVEDLMDLLNDLGIKESDINDLESFTSPRADKLVVITRPIDSNTLKPFSRYKWKEELEAEFLSGLMQLLGSKHCRWILLRIFLEILFIVIVIAYGTILYIFWDDLFVPKSFGQDANKQINGALASSMGFSFAGIVQLWNQMHNYSRSEYRIGTLKGLVLSTIKTMITVFVVSTIASLVFWAPVPILAAILKHTTGSTSAVPDWGYILINVAVVMLVFMVSNKVLIPLAIKMRVRSRKKRVEDKLSNDDQFNDHESNMKEPFLN
eukprot:gb/GECH01008496.1/.p1 GENE.gb/GECH01008496.1/~~gb/GECH01008496.1/.p1  ORF type:complete len:493 (+),score=79.13 gb/GECH01008496.1/:1-1479(+)